MSSYPYIISENSLTVFLQGEAFTVDATAPNYQAIESALADGVMDEDYLRSLFGGYDTSAAMLFDDSANNGLVKVTRNGVTYAGHVVNSVLADRMVDIADKGLPLEPWVNFLNKVMANPEPFAQEELYLWLAKSDLPITDDGDFLAYKKVNDDFTDIYSGTIDNSPGQTVVMPGGRSEVDNDRDNLCSIGLHFCSKSYLPQFGRQDGDRVVLVKVNPTDVVSIPADYQNAKGRTWKYEVVQEITGLDPHEINLPPVVHVEDSDIYTDFVWSPEDDDWDDDFDDDWDALIDEDDNPWSAPAPQQVKGFWKTIWQKVTA
jgi:hypothetical protein